MAIDIVVQRAAGLDIAKASLVACIRTPDGEGGWQIAKRKFTTMTADLLALADWLGEHGITRVGMESTADYWRPVFYVLLLLELDEDGALCEFPADDECRNGDEDAAPEDCSPSPGLHRPGG